MADTAPTFVTSGSTRRGTPPRWRSARVWRWVNLVLAIAWVAMVPVSMMTGWIYSVAFISGVSIYANFVSHIAGWRADEPVEAEQRAVPRGHWDERD
jgi:hypothetical protein